jgi:hypothetical protein
MVKYYKLIEDLARVRHEVWSLSISAKLTLTFSENTIKRIDEFICEHGGSDKEIEEFKMKFLNEPLAVKNGKGQEK